MLLVKMVRTVASALKKTGIICLTASLMGMASSGYLRAELRLENWKSYAYLAEQGAICASFSSLMEAQSVLNPDIGRLWQERRKYAGAVIRKAAEFELKRSPDADEINMLVSQYSDWVIESLMSKDAPTFNGADNTSQQGLIGQQKMQKLIDSYCRTMFAQGDSQILASNPDLGYLLGTSSASPKNTKPAKTTPATAVPASTNNAGQQITLNIGQGASFSLSLPQAAPPRTEPAPIAQEETPKSPVSNAAPLIKAPARTEPAKPQKPQPIPVIATPQSGALIIQLGSFSQKDNAEAIRQKLRASYPDMLQHIKLNINEHRLTTGSLFYRIETQTLDQDTAQLICDFLWAERLPCLLKSV